MKITHLPESPSPLSALRREELALLRQTLTGKFPGAHPAVIHPFPGAEAPPAEDARGAFPITHPSLSSPLHLQKGELTEAHGPLAAGALLLEAALMSVAEARSMMGLVDGRSGFDPTLPEALLSRLLWVMARDAVMAIRAADLLLRDGNLPLVALDLQLNPPEELRRIPASTWYRFQRILENGGGALLVLTPRAMIASAAVRITLSGRWSLDAMNEQRAEHFPEVLLRRRHQHPGALVRIA